MVYRSPQSAQVFTGFLQLQPIRPGIVIAVSLRLWAKKR